MRSGTGNIEFPTRHLSISKESFIYRSAMILNKLPENIRNEKSMNKFKTKLKKWSVENILTKPKQKFPTIVMNTYPMMHPNPVAHRLNEDIRQFLIPHNPVPDRSTDGNITDGDISDKTRGTAQLPRPSRTSDIRKFLTSATTKSHEPVVTQNSTNVTHLSRTNVGLHSPQVPQQLVSPPTLTAPTLEPPLPTDRPPTVPTPAPTIE